MRISPKTRAAFAAVAFASLRSLLAPAAHAQGCVAAHSPQPIIAGLNPTSQFGSHSFANGEWLHNLTLTVGYRAYNSFRHYVGTDGADAARNQQKRDREPRQSVRARRELPVDAAR